MTGYGRAIGENHRVGDPAIVSDMAVGHQKVIRANDGLLLRITRAVNGAMLPEGISFADTQARRFPFVFQVLRRLPDDAPGEKSVIGANVSFAGEIDTRPDNTAGAELDVLV